ncbi:hypothetical protein HUJ05_007111 [Dendroctonus ponderosae]|nr:hypothetical protein HUJ05_007111 [Dendroctonus ponderosae]
MQRTRKTLTTKSRCYCSVFGCSNYITPQISLHIFPPDPKMRKKWSDSLQMTKPIGRGMRVCSEHFVKNDFFITTEHSVRRRLKRCAVPSQKLPGDFERELEKIQTISAVNETDMLNNTPDSDQGANPGDKEDVKIEIIFL